VEAIEKIVTNKPIFVKFVHGLNTLIWLLLVTDYFKLTITSIVLFIFTLFWALSIIMWRIKNTSEEKLLYLKVLSSDYIRIFFICLLGYHSFATFSSKLFLLSLIFTVPFMLILFTIGVFECIKNKTITMIAIGSFLFTLFLFNAQKYALSYHFGVPILGHFLEKPEYTALYYIKLQPIESKKEFHYLAQIKVGNRPEELEYEDSNYETYTKTIWHRDIWIKKFQYTSSRWVEVVEQDEPLEVGSCVLIKDEYQREWYAEIADKNVNMR